MTPNGKMSLQELRQFRKEVFSLYFEEEKNLQEVAKKFNTYPSTIKSLIEENGMRTRNHKTELKRKSHYSFDHSFFDMINTEEKAYCLGFFFADGYNDYKTGENGKVKEGSIKYKISKEDEEILYKIRNCFNGNMPIKQLPASLIYNKWNGKTYISSPQVRLSFFDVDMCQRMIELGGDKNKTYSLKFPYDKMDSSLYRHFIRGFFDGDGTIFRQKGCRHPCYGFIGVEEFLLEIQEICFNELNITPKRMFQSKGCKVENIKYFQVCKTEDCYNFLTWLYEDATIYLERKYNRYYQYYHNGIMFTTYEEGGW